MKEPINNGLDERLFKYIVHSIETTPFYQLLGIRLNAVGPGNAEIGVLSNQKHSNPLGLIHGGLIMSLADAAMGNAIRSLGIKGVTVDCSTSFPAAAGMGSNLLARGEVLKAGRKMIFARAVVYEGDTVIGDAKATFFNTGKFDYQGEDS